MNKRVAAAAVIGGALLLTGCAGETTASAPTTTATPTPSPTPTRTPLQAAVWNCGLPDTTADQGHTLELNAGVASSKFSMSNVSCVLSKTNVPTSVVDEMNATRALDGMQRATWGNFKASWTYHPDHGFNVILTDQ